MQIRANRSKFVGIVVPFGAGICHWLILGHFYVFHENTYIFFTVQCCARDLPLVTIGVMGPYHGGMWPDTLSHVLMISVVST